MGQCRWADSKSNDLDVAVFMSMYTVPERLNPRCVLFRGRAKHANYHKASKCEKILRLGPVCTRSARPGTDEY